MVNQRLRKASIVEVLRALHAAKGLTPHGPGAAPRIGFALTTRDRLDFTLRTLPSIDTNEFDLIWVDGSRDPDARNLLRNHRFQRARLVEAHFDHRAGPVKAIEFALKRLLALGYDYCGLLENDVLLSPGWYEKLLEIFTLAAQDGLVPGAATVRNYAGRVIEYRTGYTINWNSGAGMILFSRHAAQILLSHYRYEELQTSARRLQLEYANLLHLDLRPSAQLFGGWIDRRLVGDQVYDLLLLQHGFCSIGSIPSLALDLQFDLREQYGDDYVGNVTDVGLAFPPASAWDRFWSRAATVVLSAGWGLMDAHPSVLPSIKRICGRGAPAESARSYSVPSFRAMFSDGNCDPSDSATLNKPQDLGG